MFTGHVKGCTLFHRWRCLYASRHKRHAGTLHKHDEQLNTIYRGKNHNIFTNHAVKPLCLDPSCLLRKLAFVENKNIGHFT